MTRVSIHACVWVSFYLCVLVDIDNYVCVFSQNIFKIYFSEYIFFKGLTTWT